MYIIATNTPHNLQLANRPGVHADDREFVFFREGGTRIVEAYQSNYARFTAVEYSENVYSTNGLGLKEIEIDCVPIRPTNAVNAFNGYGFGHRQDSQECRELWGVIRADFYGTPQNEGGVLKMHFDVSEDTYIFTCKRAFIFRKGRYSIPYKFEVGPAQDLSSWLE